VNGAGEGGGGSGEVIVSIALPTMWVAGGQSGNTLAYSTNGTNWTTIPGSTSLFSTAGFGASYSANQKLWVAAGYGINSLAYSNSAATNWTGISGSTTLFSTCGYGVEYSATQNIWVAGGQTAVTGSGNTIGYSTNGTTWTGLVTAALSLNMHIAKYSAYQNLWVGVGYNSSGNSLAYSTNGITWTGVPGSNSIFSTDAKGIAYSVNQDLWTAAGEGASHSLAYSTNGTTWTGLGKTAFTTSANDVACSFTQNMWIAAGTGTHSLAYSKNGFTWTGVTLNSIYSTNGIAVAYSENQKLWVSSGTGTNTMAYSTNAVTWTGSGATPFSSQGWSVGCTNYNTYIMSLGGNMATSTDGIRWVQRTTPFGGAFPWGLWYNPSQDLFMACVGNSSSVNNMYSTIDGVTWVSRSGNLFNGANGGYCVSYGNGLWISGGQGTVNTMATSPDGITWTGRGTTVFTTGCGAVAYANNLWVASGIGGNCIATSPDGITWTGRNTNFFGTSYGGQGCVIYHPVLGLWIVGGQAGTYCIVTSPDGITWTGRATSTLAQMCYGLAYSPTLILAACRTTNNMAYSTDGTTWTAHPSPPSAAVQSIGYNFQTKLWTCGGFNPTYINSSVDGFTWVNRTGTVLASYGCALAMRY